MPVKIFINNARINNGGLNELEKEINEWEKENPDFFITERCQTSFGSYSIVITIGYRDKTASGK